MDNTAEIQTRGVHSSPRLYLLAASLVVCSACSLLGGSTDTTRLLEPVAENPTVACDNADGVGTGGPLAGHVWEARVGLVPDQVTVRVDRHTTSGVAVRPMPTNEQGALHIVSEAGLMILTGHVPIGWHARLVLPDGHEQILCRFAEGPGGSSLVAAAQPLVELRQVEIIDDAGQVIFSIEDQVLKDLAAGQVGAMEVVFGR